MHHHDPPYVAYKPSHLLLCRFLLSVWILGAAGGGYPCRAASIGLVLAVVVTS